MEKLISISGSILIVDDVLDNLRYLSKILVEHGFTVRAAKNGKEALLSAKNSPPDLILLDIKLPDIDGYSVCKTLKSADLTKDIPVIFLSMLTEPKNVIKGFQVGGVDYITKPFHTEEVLIRVQTQLKIVQSEKRYKNLSNLTYEGIIIHENGIVKDINLSFEKMFGYSNEEMIGQNVIELLIPEEYHGIVSENMLNVHSTPYEIEVKRKDGSVFPVELEGRNISDTTRVVAVRDISYRKEAEKRISKLSTAVEQSPTIIAITDLQHKIEYVNGKFTELTGYALKEVIGQTPRILTPGNLPDKVFKELWETISSGKEWRGEFYNKKKNGEYFWEETSVSPVRDEEGNIINYVIVAEDICERVE